MPDRSDRNRSTFGYWLPLIVTATVATAGLAAWVWSERKESRYGHYEDYDDDESETDEHLSYGEEKPPRQPKRPGYGTEQDAASVGVTDTAGPVPPYPGDSRGMQDEGFVSRVQDVIRRTPSPQQIFDNAGKRVAAGMAAAGAAVGGALSAIREEDRDDFGDHSRWTEEAIMRRNVEARSAESSRAVDVNAAAFARSMKGGHQGGRRKTVCIVVSADFTLHEEEGGFAEHASILSHIHEFDPRMARLFVLIYAPSLKRGDGPGAPPSLTSSYSAISTPAQTPGEERLTGLDPRPFSTSSGASGGALTPAMSATSPDNSLYASLTQQASHLVEDPTMIMPFTTPSGHIHLLRHLAPDLAYVTEPLAGQGGEWIEQIRSWVGQVVVVVGGPDGAGLGGLVDTEDEEGQEKGGLKKPKWWESTDMVGLGKGVEIVDGVRVAEDFERRVQRE